MKKVLLFSAMLLINSVLYANDENDIKALVYKWNELHNTRNTIEFKSLYAPNVLYYGRYYSGEKCYKKKAAFLTPDFFQEIISPITLTYYSSGTIKGSFTKRVSFKRKVKEHICYLLIERRGNKLFISGESDVVTDQNLKVNLDLGEEISGKTKLNTGTIVSISLAVIAIVLIGYRYSRKKKRELPLNSREEISSAIIEPRTSKWSTQKMAIEASIIDKVKFAVLEEIKGPDPILSEQKKKGDDFENYIVTLFNQGSNRFSLKEWRSDKKADNGMYALSNHNPDLEFEFMDGYRAYPFAIECKWRAKFQGGSLCWAKPYQIENYLNYQKKKRIPVFVAIGLGGDPSSPDQLFVVPLNEIKMYPNVFESYLMRFKRNTSHSFYYNPRQKMLY